MYQQPQSCGNLRCECEITPHPLYLAAVGFALASSTGRGKTEVDSQPHITEPHFSPVLAKYSEYLKYCYSARSLAPQDKYFPTKSALYVSLAMLHKEVYDPQKRDEFTRQTSHGEVDQILTYKSPIGIEDLLTDSNTVRAWSDSF